MEIIDLQLEVLNAIVNTQHSRYKIFKCPEELYSRLVQMDTIGSYPIIKRRQIEDFRGHVGLTDPNLYVVDTTNADDVERLVVSAKNWFYYGERFDTTAYMAFLKDKYEDPYFMEDLKLSQLELEMDNDFLLDNILQEIKKGA